MKDIREGNKVSEPETYWTDMKLHIRGELHADFTEEILICVVVWINLAQSFRFIKVTAHIDLSINHANVECIFH